MSTYNFTIFYIDRLAEDNKNFIWNSAIKVFQDFISTYEDNIEMNIPGAYDGPGISVELFTDDYADECAGGWINVSFEVDNTEFNKCNKIN